ncbi:hypothetical protein JW721_04285 [Candidatus Micrarchaeota archaeon]|nr:hypothetical protein [Candidatus Micrarchaeota archaeon]
MVPKAYEDMLPMLAKAAINVVIGEMDRCKCRERNKKKEEDSMKEKTKISTQVSKAMEEVVGIVAGIGVCLSNS